MEEKIYAILRKHRLPLKKREELMVDLCDLYNVSSCISVGDEVLYVGTYIGTVINENEVKLRDGTTVCSLYSQPHKFRKLI